MEGGGVGVPTLWFRHILGSFWVLFLYEERVFYYNFYYFLQYGNYYCWDNGKVQYMLIVLEDSLKNRDSCFIDDSRDRGLVSGSLIALCLLLTQQG